MREKPLYAICLKTEFIPSEVRYTYHERYKTWVELRAKVFDNEQQAMDFIDTHKRDIDWEYLSKDAHGFSEAFIRKYWNHLFADLLCQFYHFSESFIREYGCELKWELVSRYQKMSYKFIKEMENYIVMDELRRNWNISDDTLDKIFS